MLRTEAPAVAAPPLTGAEFRAALSALEPRYWDAHPFHTRLHQGLLDEDGLRLWVANRWYYQRSIPQKDAAILANCPLAEVRRQWLPRIVYHDGADAGSGGTEMWLRLAEAVGLSRAAVLSEEHVLPGVRFAVDAYISFARRQPWLESVASGLTELFSPGLLRHRLRRLREHYPWIADQGLAYFTARLDVVEAEGAGTLDLVVRHATTRAQQDACVAALSFKCQVLQAVLDAVDYRYTAAQAKP
ncbi:pyrroloquinoline quinone biosynthesis protein C [Streptacidiphilus pinicola]|uniref:Pyrroloquinoline-quinone synthase n=1 Tax=Streptacidiphilus pinicola TaxID=2219663 RepID=A0A2X0J6C6_9ACTN|nr:pyrroloquinoline quinone biosynthesis protein C [Streptacidiphilus pinicola]